MRPFLILATAVALTQCTAPPTDEAQKPRVLILVVDGLRPDYVTPELMPRLNALAEQGVRGLAHHAVFPTETRVNGPSIFTGRYPGGHGQMGNTVFFEQVDSSRVLNAGDAADLRLIDEATNSALLTAPSLGEILEEQSLTYFAASSGGSGSGLLMNHRGASAGLVHHTFALPDTLDSMVEELLGPVPSIPTGSPSVPLAARAIDALLRIGVDRADADVLAIWVTEPDGTGHRHGVGAPETLSVLADVDAEIGRLLDGLEERGVLATTNILVTSDHGFSTRTGSESTSALLVEAGLKTSSTSTDVVVAGSAIHVREGGEERISSIVQLLQKTDWVGPVFTRTGSPEAEVGSQAGTVAFSAVGWSHERSSDILVSPNWSDAVNGFGYAGEVTSPGVAGHGSSSPLDIRATFLASGPDVKPGVTSRVPTGNIDIVPTVLALLGTSVPDGLDGRVISEALLDGPDVVDVEVVADSIVATTGLDGLRYTLTVHRSWVGPTMYFDGTSVSRRR
ncbi:MAG: alkaline phosphatase family protein [Gemmatimonadales bacterium]|nr:alkaline phosphatase family protein [Gemmatimonadales bacterium]MBT5697468.1 alkaline phosphatase family protein [Gemmatimonadales bacterium]MBT6696166.1 alkaline phosphatase family protein [Gemmatimonadales bacterium]MBT7126534.1 alkaline phosphatase family protein [Gemmatimonadales bacterium]MBT7692333.1 alkaline phosphatase family protein [Gemmatimonadales bacterium]